MDNRTLFAAGIAVVLAAVALGFVVKGTTTPATTTPTAIDVPAAGEHPAAATSASSATPPPKAGVGDRHPPDGPMSVTTYTTSPTGLQFADISEGTGPMPTAGSIVSVEYSGWLKSTGKLFDSSYNSRGPIDFVIGAGQVIPGWDEGVMSMKKGGKRQLVIPPDLGYGVAGFPPVIPGGSTLVFDVELVDIKPPRPPGPAVAQKVADSDLVTTASGLKYHDFVVGTGAQPQAGQMVSVDYTGWLTDGTKFDSSFDHKPSAPIQFPIGQHHVIPGWDEGVMSMKVGGKRQLVIPSDLAYGDKGRPPRIPPKSTLVFEVELVGVQ